MIAAIPSPEQAVWYLGPLPIRAYALCILAGIVVALWWTGRRLDARGASEDAVWDIAIWAIPFGIIGGRLYHVITTPGPYFGPGGHPLDALKIWNGGLGIWGAVALGALGGWIGCRRTGVSFRDLGTAIAPALPVAQAIGRWGNWFNNELYGGPTDAPWGLQIHAWDASRGEAVRDAAGNAIVLGTFQPTFLYESLWCLVIAALLVLLERTRRPAAGQLFAAYIMLYTLGRGVIESLRIDEAQMVLGLRLNVWTSVVVFCLGAFLWWLWRPRGESADRARPTAAATRD
ncbi:prolipoprotein diacylglyceryl transferase [Mobilicoccus massiliensis]|uniref:prolipoprotein diacylglyceryl transferase n=1 Tax=Mobilicoccus massiliensis TaxID=1522310 RepID=UPI00058D903D|nr:prolipoprotein diacylglyceryl transferase [Mobilicoccus massiliensis]